MLHYQPEQYPRTFEKNWVPFTWRGKLLFIYSICPKPVVLSCLFAPDGQVRGDRRYMTCSKALEDPSPRLCPKGLHLRGSTAAVLLDQQTPPVWLAVAHTTKGGRHNRTYSHHFYSFEAEPPFALQQVSQPFSLPLGPTTYLEGHTDAQFCTGIELLNRSMLRLDYGVADCVPLSMYVPLRTAFDLFRNSTVIRNSTV